MSEQDQQRLIEFGRFDAWSDSRGYDAGKAREQAARLELRARAEDEIAIREEYIRLLRVAPGERVLEVGCGSGAVTRALARCITRGGSAVGLDASPALLAIARELADEAGLGRAVEFKAGDCRALPFPDAGFDVVLAVTTLAHVPGADGALREMVRVTRPGGRVGIFDFDGDAFLIAHPDRACTRRIVEAFCDHGAVDGWLMRSLPGLLRDLGIADVRTRGFMPLETGGFYATLAERAAEVALQAGAIASDEHARWLDALRAQIAAGGFLGGRAHLFVWGTRANAR